jgi:hypothetical protein
LRDGVVEVAATHGPSVAEQFRHLTKSPFPTKSHSTIWN